MAAREPETPTIEGVHFMTLEEGKAMFEREAQRLLGMSGEEFLRRWNAGEYDDQPERPEIIRLVFMSEFAK